MICKDRFGVDFIHANHDTGRLDYGIRLPAFPKVQVFDGAVRDNRDDPCTPGQFQQDF